MTTGDESGAQSAGNADVGSAVRQAREQAGLTQTALAERLGTTQTCISYWETGKRDMGAADLVKAAAALGVPAASLLPGTAPVFLGEFARVDIMGHDSRTGWVTDGSLAGAACLDVRDQAGRLIAKIPPHSVYMYQPVMPGPAPAGELASGDGAGLLPEGDPWKDERDAQGHWSGN